MLPFGRTLKLGCVGSDVKGMKRALARAGYGPKTLAGITPVFGPFTATWLGRFQHDRKLTVDKTYGPVTHKALTPFYDAIAAQLYLAYGGYCQLPERFTPTHQTSGLPGYPAIDIFAKAGTKVGAPCDGLVRKHSGHTPTPVATPGGPYGWSIYIHRPDGGDYFLTHFGTRYTSVGQQVRKGDVIGTIADYTAATNGVTPSHIHEGLWLP